MMQGKLQGQTLEDALILAKDNGIRKAEAIIKEVASAICKFRIYAEECGVGQQWIAAVETCLNNHLSEWGFLPDSSSPSFEIDGILYENVRVEQTYKGNFHLLCETQGKERKFVISKTRQGMQRLKKQVLLTSR